MATSADASTTPRAAASLARSSALMTLGTIISRATGVARLAVIAAVLGIAETRLPDTYNLANTIPNMIYELVLGGVTGAIFVPLFVELLEKEERERAWEVMSAILNLALLVLSAIALAGIVLAPWIARFYAMRLSGEVVELQQEVITFLLRLFIPQILLYGLYSVGSAMLNANKRFGPPMFTPIANNLVLIAVLVAFGQLYGVVSLASVTTTQLLILGIGTTASVAPMGLLLVPYVRRLGRYRPTLKVHHPALRKLRNLAIFFIGFVAANQIGYVLVQWLANAQQGGYTAYVSAFTFFLLPVGLFVWSITTALLPSLSQHATNERWDDYRHQLGLGLRSVMFLTLPAAVGYLLLARPVVRLLLQHGVATAVSTELVAGVLSMFVLGLVQFSMFQLTVRAFYALQDARTPFLINCGVIALAIAVNIPLFAWLGVQGLALGHSIAYSAGIALQLAALAKRIGGLDARPLLSTALRSAMSALAMGAAVWLSWAALGHLVDGDNVVALGAALALVVALGAACYLGAALLLRVDEVSYLRSVFTRRSPGASAR